MPRGDRMVRQWRLLQLVSRPDGLTIADAAQELDCSVRTIWRDLEALQASGFPIYDERAGDGRRGVWRVESSFQRRLPFPVTLDEVVAFVLASKFVAAAGAGVLGPALTSFVDKVRSLLAPRALALLDRMAAGVGLRALGAKLLLPAAEHLPLIQRALHEHRALHVLYYSMSRGAESERRLDPYYLTSFAGGLYLVAYCHLRQRCGSSPSSASGRSRPSTTASRSPQTSTWRRICETRGASCAAPSSS